MKTISIKHIDAFTNRPFTGNPAAVVVSPNGMGREQMQRIAREMNLSETAFILPPSTKNADLRIRWFTPTNEVELCGHATIASFHAIAEEKLYGLKNDGKYTYRLETASGILPVEVQKSRDKVSVKFGLPLPHFRYVPQLKLHFYKALGVESDAFDKRLHGVEYVNAYLPVRRLATLFEIKPNMELLKNLLAQRNLGGVCVFTTETVDRGSAFHSRFFAPSQGINEDPVTGSTNGPLGAYMVEYGIVSHKEGVVEMTGEQGDIMGRPGRVKVEVTVAKGRPASVAIIGSAVTVLEGRLVL